MNWELGITLGFIAFCFLAVRHDLQSLKPKKRNVDKKIETDPKSEFVYILSNPHYREGLFKIGLTTKDVNSRKSQLYSTGVPGPFDTCMVIRTDNCRVLEKSLHDTFSNKRVSKSREWFVLDDRDISSIVSAAGSSIIHHDKVAVRRALGAA